MKNNNNFEKTCNCKHKKYEGPQQSYSFYSKVLNKPFDTVEELTIAEDAYFAEQKAKEDKTTQKKVDAQKVEDAFKALNAARKTYKEDLSTLTQEYCDSLTDLKKAFELGKKDISSKLATAEEEYSAALKEFTDKYNQYHLSLRDGDFETTISGSTTQSETKEDVDLLNLFDLLFNF